MTGSDLITAVIEGLAEADGVEPEALDYNLYDHIDTAILASLDGQDDDFWVFTFQVPDHEVTLTGRGAIYIDDTLYRRGRRSISGDPDTVDQSLIETQHTIQGLLNNLPGMAYRCRNVPGWPMEVTSEGCRQLTGYDPNAFIVGGVSYGDDVIHPDDREAVWEQVQAAIQADEPFYLTYRIRTADGEQKQVWEKGTAIFEQDEVVALVGFITDVTDIKRERGVPGKA